MDQSTPTVPVDPAAQPPAVEPPLESQADRISSSFATLQSELDALHKAVADQEHRAAELDAREAALREHASLLSDREFQLGEQHREMNAARETLVAEASAWKGREIEIAARERAVEAGKRDDSWITSRRARLKKQRTLLAERASQLIQAKQMLESRLSDTGRTRHSLPVAGGAAAVPATMPQPSRPAARGGFGAFAGGMLASAAALAVIAGTSWWVAGQMDHAVFVAQTTIAMEASHEPRAMEDMESWEAFHLELAKDPQLLEAAAERLQQRGYGELRSPTDLRRFLDQNLSIERGTPGRLDFALSGEGRLRAQRILEAYVGAVVSMSNDSRERRADRSSTVIASPAACGDEPVVSQRLALFGATGGAMTLLCAGMGLGAMKLVGGARAASGSPSPSAEADEDRWAIR